MVTKTYYYYTTTERKVKLKLPNGYGSVYKLSGKRRNPWCARKTVGWKQVPEKKKSYPVYEFIGYFKSRTEALQALANYNEDPYDLSDNTFEEIYNAWSEVHFRKIKNPNGYVSAFRTCEPIHNKIFAELKLQHYQNILDTCGKNTPTLKKIKSMLGMMYDYAIINELVSADKREMIRYLDITKPGNPNAFDRKPFAKKDIKKLWESESSNKYISLILILIYTGVRISELLDLKKEDVHLDERYFFVKESKTDAGIREVPIAEKIVPLFQYWISLDCPYLVCTIDLKHFVYRNYYDSYWKPIMKALNMEYTPHCTRHTCISLLTEVGTDERIIQQIVGHKGQNVTQIVYTHVDLPKKLEAVNKL